MDTPGQGKPGGLSDVKDSDIVDVPTEIAQNLKVADEDEAFKYDNAARNLVAEKPILAYILKSVLDEYKEYSVQEIAEQFIEGTPKVADTAVYPDHPDKPNDTVMMNGDDKIKGLPTADKSQRDGDVYYDVRFLAALPQSGEFAEVFVNVEIQNNDTPGYAIPKRGIYYASRMISSQRGTIFKNQEYGKIKKVVSIWICEDSAISRSDTINRYSFTEECLRGDFHEKKQDYDLMTVVVLRLGDKGENSKDDAIRLLSKMFSDSLGYDEKMDALQDEFKISVHEGIDKEVWSMCNLSTGVYNRGKMEMAREMAYALQNKGMSLDEIADVAQVSVDTVKEWLANREEMLVK